MASILSDGQIELIKLQNRKFRKYANAGWYCEGSECNGIVCNLLYNNDTDEWFYSDYNGNILDSSNVKVTNIEDVKKMATIQGRIRKISEE